MRTRTLSLRPDYNLMTIRDAIPPEDRKGADEAATRAGTEIAAASSEEVFICAAQRTIPVRLIVKAYSRPRAAGEGADWDGSLMFEIDFPSGVVRFGDMFHRADSMELPAGAGRYLVTVHYAGREVAFQSVEEIYSLPDPEEQDLRSERLAGLERYLVVLSPAAA